jgi:hypothetical protein
VFQTVIVLLDSDSIEFSLSACVGWSWVLTSCTVKVTAIEESKDLDFMKVEEFVGCLQQYKLSLPVTTQEKTLATSALSPQKGLVDLKLFLKLLIKSSFTL